jgi:hypothetical protein
LLKRRTILLLKHFPEVLEVVGILIRSLTKADNLFDAERYAEVTYMNLKDRNNGSELEGKEVAEGAYNLADVIYKQKGDLSRGFYIHMYTHSIIF